MPANKPGKEVDLRTSGRDGGGSQFCSSVFRWFFHFFWIIGPYFLCLLALCSVCCLAGFSWGCSLPRSFGCFTRSAAAIAIVVTNTQHPKTSSSCGHHHGRQRTLGASAGYPIHRGTSARRGERARNRPHFQELGIDYLTLYCSTENWNRPRAEVSALMRLLEFYLKQEIKELNKNNVRLAAIGRLVNCRQRPKATGEIHRGAEEKHGPDVLVLALSYGGRVEIVDAIRSIARGAGGTGRCGVDIDEKVIWSRHARGMPDPTLLIRTSGELRVSNFLLWQISTRRFMLETLTSDFGRHT